MLDTFIILRHIHTHLYIYTLFVISFSGNFQNLPRSYMGWWTISNKSEGNTLPEQSAKANLCFSPCASDLPRCGPSHTSGLPLVGLFAASSCFQVEPRRFSLRRTIRTRDTNWQAFFGRIFPKKEQIDEAENGTCEDNAKGLGVLCWRLSNRRTPQKKEPLPSSLSVFLHRRRTSEKYKAVWGGKVEILFEDAPFRVVWRGQRSPEVLGFGLANRWCQSNLTAEWTQLWTLDEAVGPWRDHGPWGFFRTEHGSMCSGLAAARGYGGCTKGCFRKKRKKREWSCKLLRVAKRLSFCRKNLAPLDNSLQQFPGLVREWIILCLCTQAIIFITVKNVTNCQW